MTITNYDGIIEARCAGRDDDRYILKTVAGAFAFSWFNFMKVGFFPSSCSLTNATSGGAMMNSSSAGAIRFTNCSAATAEKYLLTYGAGCLQGAEQSVFGLIDVLWAGGSIQVNSSSTQTINSGNLSRSTAGYTNRIGVMVATNLSTASTMTIWYTDANDNATTVDVVLSTGGGQGRMLPTGMKYPITPNGVKSIQSVQVQTAQTNGAVDLMIFKDLDCDVPGIGISFFVERDLTAQVDGLTLLPKDSSNVVGYVTPICFTIGSTARGMQGFIRTVSG